jgi:predicted RNA-binding protein
MQTTHVFIVDTTTFKYHLEYQFAGTGAAPPKGKPERHIDFNDKPDTKYAAQTENNLVSMIADSQRVRKGDYIVFYLQQNAREGVYEGKFYGIFRAKEDLSFLDNRDDRQYLKNELIKSLTFRTLIEPFEVYAKGVTEWEALDEIRYIQSPYQMLWSLIYRKLKANRGNTMITIYESERLFKLLRDKNGHQTLTGADFTLDIPSQMIQPTTTHRLYTGRQEPIDIFPRLKRKCGENKAFESHLQAYVVQNIGRGANPSLDASLLGALRLEWLGNEVSCGVGMQRIDILLDTQKDATTRVVIPIELKADEAIPDNMYQLQRYVDWLEQYYTPNRIGDIQPILVTLPPTSTGFYSETVKAFRGFNANNPTCLPLKHVIYEIENRATSFQQLY